MANLIYPAPYPPRFPNGTLQFAKMAPKIRSYIPSPWKFAIKEHENKAECFHHRSYFDTDTGLGYNVGRVNLDSCDFSPRAYSYVDTPGDVDLATFELQEEDTVYKV